MSKYLITERLGFFRADNNIAYNIGQIRCDIITYKNLITISNTSSIYINIEELLPILKDAWEFEDHDVTKISELKYTISYNLKVINNYLSHIIIISNEI